MNKFLVTLFHIFSLLPGYNKLPYVIIDKRSFSSKLRFSRLKDFEWVTPIEFYVGYQLLEARTIRRDRVLEFFISDTRLLFIAESVLTACFQETSYSKWVIRLIVLDRISRLERSSDETKRLK